MSANCQTCNATVCRICKQVLTFYTGGTICISCTVQKLNEVSRGGTWGYNKEDKQ